MQNCRMNDFRTLNSYKSFDYKYSFLFIQYIHMIKSQTIRRPMVVGAKNLIFR